MRKTMTREVTKTTIKVAKLEMVDGEVKTVVLPDETKIGNIKLERAQRMMNKQYGEPVTVLQVIPETVVYEMPIETFIEHATIKEDKPEQDNE